MKSLLVIAEHFPHNYKPYYLDQLAAFMEEGVACHVAANGAMGEMPATFSSRYSIPVSYVPATNSAIRYRHITSLTRLEYLSRSFSAAVAAPDARWTSRVSHFVRAQLVGPIAPDAVLVHNLTTLRAYPWLKTLWPAAKVGLFYHGAETPGTVKIADPRPILSGLDFVFANTAHSAAQVITRGADPDSVFISPLGYDLAEFPWRPDRELITASPLSLAILGRCSVEKGIDVAIRAVALLKREGRVALKLTIAGDGPLLQDLKHLAHQLDVATDVEFAGRLDRHSSIALMQRTDVLLLPSRTVGDVQENQACVVQEAQLAGALIIASDIGGVAEGVAPMLRRLMVRENDPAHLARHIESVARQPVTERLRLAAESREWTMQNYDARALSSALLRVIRNAFSR